MYLASHVVLPRKVWLKTTHGGGASDMAVQMLREACLLDALSHPAIPRVFECGVRADRRPWAAFERVEGESLADTLVAGPLAVAELAVLLRNVAEVLEHAHARGVVHRALTADAILKTPSRSSSICVVNWGKASAVGADQHRADDARADVHALGAIAFRALTGCLHTPAVSATEWCPGAPRELTALIDSMLQSRPELRPTSAEVRERARWLAASFEQLAIEKPRWTPPHGVDPQTLPPVAETGTFSIRISRTRSS
ncbi:MAG: protein kinase [Deltaproteobacteria bacterium]|nr:protein kinase [Deltaproteobacteria bacterium]MDQ3298430.1 protein kinase [Myxococcota bacterium]